MPMELFIRPLRNSSARDLDSWIDRQAELSAAALESAISATQRVRRRDAFAQTIVPARGSVVASISFGDWTVEPDYFFHWVRDSAIAMRAVVALMQSSSGATQRRWRNHFEDFVRFSLTLSRCDGGRFVKRVNYRARTLPGARKHLRGKAELRALVGDAILGEPRFNPDGTLDILRWSRPQYDGAALRALTCLRFLDAGGRDGKDIRRLIAQDLDFTCRHAGARCVGPWEERSAWHYPVALLQLGALVHGRRFAGRRAEAWAAAERHLRERLDGFWSDRDQVYLAQRPARTAAARLDAAVLLAVLDADLPEGRHSVHDPRVQKTQAAIEKFFAREFPINRGKACAPLLGRYRGDRYFGGGAWYPTTLAAAALYYRRAALAGKDRSRLIGRGDAFMARLHEVTPASGALSEQIDRRTGEHRSARHLTWSHAAFVSASFLRRQALRGTA